MMKSSERVTSEDVKSSTFQEEFWVAVCVCVSVCVCVYLQGDDPEQREAAILNKVSTDDQHTAACRHTDRFRFRYQYLLLWRHLQDKLCLTHTDESV